MTVNELARKRIRKLQREYTCCPHCGCITVCIQEVQVVRRESYEVIAEFKLRCRECAATYSVLGGICFYETIE